jgi:hypothetical protein
MQTVPGSAALAIAADSAAQTAEPPWAEDRVLSVAQRILRYKRRGIHLKGPPPGPHSRPVRTPATCAPFRRGCRGLLGDGASAWGARPPRSQLCAVGRWTVPLPAAPAGWDCLCSCAPAVLITGARKSEENDSRKKSSGGRYRVMGVWTKRLGIGHFPFTRMRMKT